MDEDVQVHVLFRCACGNELEVIFSTQSSDYTRCYECDERYAVYRSIHEPGEILTILRGNYEPEIGRKS